jgi:hypothetical protein
MNYFHNTTSNNDDEQSSFEKNMSLTTTSPPSTADTFLFANTTNADDDDTMIIVGWVIIPTVLGLFLYSCIVLSVWPYARPVIPFWFLLFCILFPPFFPFLLFYVVFLFVFAAPRTLSQPTVVYVVEPRNGRVRPSMPSRTSATRV